MSSIINVLDETVINRIAAGEVVERPSSVVKELIENAIDAGSTYISIDIENGGKKLIRIRDNGIGMSNDDAFLALERHATSKLKSEKDLIGVATMGFRGEALASIASVSRLRLVTKDEREPQGMDILVEGGSLKKADRIGAGRGTIVEVRNLFFNAPVRAKFLKNRTVESGHIHELVLRIALANISIGFKYSEDGRIKIESPPVNSVLDRIASMFSRDVRQNLIAVDHSLQTMRVHGFVAKPPYARSTMRSTLTFVNRRPVKDRLVNAALNRAFTGLMERGRYPLAVLFIEVSPEDVDVNVHPQKNEVRFLNPTSVADLINQGVSQALYDSPYTTVANPGPFTRESQKLPQEKPIRKFTAKHLQESVFPEVKPVESGIAVSTTNSQAKVDLTQSTAYSDLGIIGRIPDSFIVLHDGEDIIFLDQHAAHERLVFDSLLQARNFRNDIQSQNLLLPKVVSLSPVEAQSIRSHKEILASSGIIFEDFGPNDILIKACPQWIAEADTEDVIRDLAGTIMETGMKPDPESLVIEIFKTLACKASVKETTPIQTEEIKALLKALDANRSPRVCPHGRPLTVKIPLTEIRRRLGRSS